MIIINPKSLPPSPSIFYLLLLTLTLVIPAFTLVNCDANQNAVIQTVYYTPISTPPADSNSLDGSTSATTIILADPALDGQPTQSPDARSGNTKGGASPAPIATSTVDIIVGAGGDAAAPSPADAGTLLDTGGSQLTYTTNPASTDSNGMSLTQETSSAGLEPGAPGTETMFFSMPTTGVSIIVVGMSGTDSGPSPTSPSTIEGSAFTDLPSATSTSTANSTDVSTLPITAGGGSNAAISNGDTAATSSSPWPASRVAALSIGLVSGFCILGAVAYAAGGLKWLRGGNSGRRGGSSIGPRGTSTSSLLFRRDRRYPWDDDTSRGRIAVPMSGGGAIPGLLTVTGGEAALMAAGSSRLISYSPALYNMRRPETLQSVSPIGGASGGRLSALPAPESAGEQRPEVFIGGGNSSGLGDPIPDGIHRRPHSEIYATVSQQDRSSTRPHSMVRNGETIRAMSPFNDIDAGGQAPPTAQNPWGQRNVNNTFYNDMLPSPATPSTIGAAGGLGLKSMRDPGRTRDLQPEMNQPPPAQIGGRNMPSWVGLPQWEETVGSSSAKRVRENEAGDLRKMWAGQDV